MTDQIFKNEEGLLKLENWYRSFLDKIDAPVISEELSTSYGTQHVLIAGDQSKPPLVVLHSMMTGSSHVVSELQRMLNKFHIIAPDIPGQSVKGIPKHLSYNSYEHAAWLKEIMEGLKVERADIIGVSLGGFIARQFAEKHPERVRGLILIVPAGIIQGSLIKGFLKMAIPMIRYKLRPNEKNLYKLAKPLLTTMDEDWVSYLGDAYTAFKPYMKIPPLADDEQLEALSMPCLVITGELDISFPGVPLNERVSGLIPKAETELIEKGKHSPPLTEEFRNWLTQRVVRFTEQIT